MMMATRHEAVYLINSSASTTNTEHETAMVTAVAQIVSAFVAKTNVTQAELPTLISSVHRSLTSLSAPASKQPEAPKAPAVSVKKSITPEFLVCLEDGKKFKSLKRHLRSQYGLTPEQYHIMRQHGTEFPGSCALLHEKRAGTFRCAGCEQPLFESTLKFESGTGWPSFNDPIPGSVETSTDR